MNAKRGLGRGLDALIKPVEAVPNRVMQVGIASLHPNPDQPREKFDPSKLKQLEKSIRSQGILQPILVRKNEGSGYQIVAGERRWRAAQAAGLNKVPVILKEVDDDALLEIALIENLQREDLNPVEEARAYKLLMDRFKMTQNQVSQRVGRERATVANSLRLLTLPPRALKALETGDITPGHAKAILSQKTEKNQTALLSAILDRGLSVRQAEDFKGEKSSTEKTPDDPDTKEAAKKMTMQLGLKVSIRRRGKGGSVVISFKDEAELQHLYDWIGKGRRR